MKLIWVICWSTFTVVENLNAGLKFSYGEWQNSSKQQHLQLYFSCLAWSLSGQNVVMVLGQYGPALNTVLNLAFAGVVGKAVEFLLSGKAAVQPHLLEHDLPQPRSMYKVLSLEEICSRFPGYTEVFPDSGTASCFQNLPAAVRGMVNHTLSGVKRPSTVAGGAPAPGVKWSARVAELTASSGIKDLSTAELDLISSGKLPKCSVVEINALHHPVRYIRY